MGAGDDTGVSPDEKLLIIASAVLGTILVTLVCFAALYRAFLSQYANAYDNHLKLLNPFNVGELGTQAVPMTTSPSGSELNQVQIRLASTPSNNDFEISTNAVAETSFSKAATTSYVQPDTGFSPQTKSEVLNNNSNATKDTSKPSEAWASPTSVEQESEFFSADEQAKIWAELRQAENDAKGASDSVNTARAAAAAASMTSPGSVATITSMGLGDGEYAPTSGAGEYVETFQENPDVQVQVAQSVTVSPGVIKQVESDDDSDDATTTFGFGDLLSPSPAKSPAAVASPDYLEGDTLVNMGEVDNSPAYSASVNADNEWWK